MTPGRNFAPFCLATLADAADTCCTHVGTPALAEAGAGEAGALDLHEGIVGVGLQTGCDRWPEPLRLRGQGPDGVQYVRGRCGATNLCRYCQTLAVVETVEMLTLDAMEWPPTLWVVLTAREHLTRAQCRRHLEALRDSLRRRWPAIEWFVQVEFQRRGALHLNLLVKGVAVDDQAELHERVCRIWCRRVDAEPVAQWVGAIEDARGTVAYISKMLAHGLKAEQAPPIGWKGHRTSQTRGYLVRPAGEMREEAKRSLRLKRALRRGVPPELLELELEREDAIAWELVDVRRIGRVIDPDPVAIAGAPRGQQVEVAPAVRAGEVARDPAPDDPRTDGAALVDEVERCPAPEAQDWADVRRRVAGGEVHALSLGSEADGP